MTDYYPVLVRTVLDLDINNRETRQASYERAREALAAQLQEYQPAIPAAIILQEKQALEVAIRRLDAELSSSFGPDSEDMGATIKTVRTIVRCIACFAALATVSSMYFFSRRSYVHPHIWISTVSGHSRTHSGRDRAAAFFLLAFVYETRLA